MDGNEISGCCPRDILWTLEVMDLKSELQIFRIELRSDVFI